MFANKFKDFCQTRYFLFASCLLIFALSIFLRSTIDIGADTAVYLDLGKKVFDKKKYYFDFFESNFPISFYFYALQYKAAQILHLSPIILSEIVINLLALFAIFFCAKILKRTTIFENKAHYNLIIIAYFLGFFLRPYALQIGEFGTKTSLLLLLLFPYISYSFQETNPWNKKDLIARGILMGLIPCIKPHYLILLILVEAQRFWQKKSLRFFLELDKLMMALIGAFALFLMMKFTPEYFEFIPPMWSKTYAAYAHGNVFLKNFWHNSAIMLQFIFVFLLFARTKISANDKVLILFFLSSIILISVENLGTIDQIVVFYAVASICFLKFIFDIFAAQKNIFYENRFIILAVILLPIFDMEILPAAFLGLGGFVNLWWLVALIYPFVNRKKLSPKKIICFFALYFSLLFIALLTLKIMGGWAYVVTNLTILFFVLFIFEKRNAAQKFSQLSVFVIFASISSLLYCYVSSITGVLTRESVYTFPNKFSDTLVYYSKKYAPQKDENFLMVSIWIAHQFPTLNYLEKPNNQKFHMAVIQADQGVAGNAKMFPIEDSNRVFVYSYLFDDVKNAIENPKTKLVFFNNTPEILNKDNRCLIPTLEYYLLDPKFRKTFLENFHFENHVVISHKVKSLKKLHFITGEKPSIFDQIKPSPNRILYDLEVYVRN